MALTTVTIGEKGGTLRGTTGHGYLLTIPSSKVFVGALSYTGTFWIRPLSPGDALPTVDPTAAFIPANDTANASIEVKTANVWTNGDSAERGIRQLIGSKGSVVALAIWCELAGDLVLVCQ